MPIKLQEVKDKVELVSAQLNTRLPNTYAFSVKTYSTPYSLMRGVVRRCNNTYSYVEVCNYYNSIVNSDEEGYINSKYTTYRPDSCSKKQCFCIGALSGDPISVCLSWLQNCSYVKIAYMLLHEVAHNTNIKRTEKQCDEFARRWVTRIRKENTPNV